MHSDKSHEPKGRVSVAAAVLVGTAWVNIPVLSIMLGGYAGAFYAASKTNLSLPFAAPINAAISVSLFAFVAIGPWLAAWLWWSFNIPKWRIWALERVDDWRGLEGRAIAAGLIWSEDTWFGRLCAATEIWSSRDRRRFAELKRAGRG
jgi:hypothetical protein